MTNKQKRKQSKTIDNMAGKSKVFFLAKTKD